MEGEERWEAADHSQNVLPQNWGGIEQNRTVTCMVLKAKANDMRKNLALATMDLMVLDLMLLSISWHKPLFKDLPLLPIILLFNALKRERDSRTISCGNRKSSDKKLNVDEESFDKAFQKYKAIL
ncbi:hypothetical protein TNCV_3276901 [Trichonephila clavipes]|nr:hypothetical protein TNCV_3276901 [Trichonephila clavipes]